MSFLYTKKSITTKYIVTQCWEPTEFSFHLQVSNSECKPDWALKQRKYLAYDELTPSVAKKLYYMQTEIAKMNLNLYTNISNSHL